VNRDMLAPLTGVAFIVLAIISVAIMGGEPPGADDPVQEIVNHYVDNKDSIEASAFVGGLAAALLIFFAGYLRKVLSAAEGQQGYLSALVLVGAAILALGLTIDGTISIALAESADDINPTAVQALQALWDNDFLPIALGTIVFFYSAGASILATGVLPKWLGWVAILFGVLGVTPIFFIGLLGGAVWVLVVSIMLAMQTRPAAPAAPSTPAPSTGT
jgi:hypothetical protein